MPGRDDDEHPGGGVVVAVNRDAKTARSVIRAKVDGLDDRVDRIDERIDRVDEWVGEVRDRVDQLGDRIGEVREDQARMAGDVKHLVLAYEKASSISNAQVLTDIEVRKAAALAEIQERAAAATQRRAIIRELVFKAITVVMGLWAIVSAILAAR